MIEIGIDEDEIPVCFPDVADFPPTNLTLPWNLIANPPVLIKDQVILSDCSMRNASQMIGRWINDRLIRDRPPADSPLCDFNRLCYEIRPGDSVPGEDHSRVTG